MLSQSDVAYYRRNGFLKVRGLFSAAELARLQSAVERVTEEAVGYGRVLDERGPLELAGPDHGFREAPDFDEHRFVYARGSGKERVWRRAEGMSEREPAFRAALANPGLRDIAAELSGRPDVLPGVDALVVKMPRDGAACPWHRDRTGELLLQHLGDASSELIFGLYLDRSTEADGCLWVIPESHRRDGLSPDLPTTDSLDFDIPRATPLLAERGDLLVHSSGLFHASNANTSRELRRTFYVYYPAATVELRDPRRVDDRLARLRRTTGDRPTGRET